MRREVTVTLADRRRAAALALQRTARKLRITPGQREHIVLLARYRNRRCACGCGQLVRDQMQRNDGEATREDSERTVGHLLPLGP